MFQGTVAVLNVNEVDWDGVTQYQMRYAKSFKKSGRSSNSPAQIEYIVIISDITQVRCDVHQNEKLLDYLYVNRLLH
jgi:hypothetical protein